MEKKIKELKSQEFGQEEHWRPILEQRKERLKTKAEIQIMRLKLEDEAS
jgi:hypothetical protein